MAKKTEVLFKFVKVDENTPLVKLGFWDMLRVIIYKMNKDPAARFKGDDLVNRQMNELRADLIKFIKRALVKLQKGESDDVLLLIPSHFAPVIHQVKEAPFLERYYKVIVVEPEVVYEGVPFNYRMYIYYKDRGG